MRVEPFSYSDFLYSILSFILSYCILAVASKFRRYSHSGDANEIPCAPCMLCAEQSFKWVDRIADAYFFPLTDDLFRASSGRSRKSRSRWESTLKSIGFWKTARFAAYGEAVKSGGWFRPVIKMTGRSSRSSPIFSA